MPVAPRCSRPPSTMPAPSAAGDLDVDDVAGPAGGAVAELGERAEVRVVVGEHRYAEPSGAARSPGQSSRHPGRIRVRMLGDRRSSGAGTHMPTRVQVRRAPAPRPAAVAHHPRGPVERRRAVGSSTSTASVSSAEHLPRAVGRSRPARAGGRCRPPRRRRGGWSARPAAGPAAAALVRPAAVGGLDRLAARRSGRRPGWTPWCATARWRRARSARLIGPSAASRAMRARRFAVAQPLERAVGRPWAGRLGH